MGTTSSFSTSGWGGMLPPSKRKVLEGMTKKYATSQKLCGVKVENIKGIQKPF